MTRHFIIDGFNLGFKIPQIARWISRGDTDKAAQLIVNFVSQNLPVRYQKAVIVFDGKYGSTSSVPSSKHIQIKYSVKPQTADDIIRTFVRKNKNPGQWTVISSDNEILFTATDMGAVAVKSEDFANNAVDEPTRPGSKEKEQMDKYDPENVDVNYWLKQFGADDSDES